MKRLEEVIEITGLSRRMIQEFQKYGLAKKPKLRNKFGHYLYDDADIERLWELRFYKELDYDAPDIAELERGLYEDRIQRLEKLISELENKREKLSQLINIAKTMQVAGVSVSTISKIYAPLTESNFNDFLTIAANGLYPDLQTDYSLIDTILTDEDEVSLCNTFDHIVGTLFEADPPNYTSAISDFEMLYSIWKKVFPDSIEYFQGMLNMMLENYDFVKEITESFGEKAVKVAMTALNMFCEKHGATEMDRDYERSLTELPRLRIQGNDPTGDEVQKRIAMLFRIYADNKIISVESALGALDRFAKTYVASAERNSVLTVEKKDADYLQKAISYFIEKKQEELTNGKN